jgi:hypothetical protein
MKTAAQDLEEIGDLLEKELNQGRHLQLPIAALRRQRADPESRPKAVGVATYNEFRRGLDLSARTQIGEMTAFGATLSFGRVSANDGSLHRFTPLPRSRPGSQ